MALTFVVFWSIILFSEVHLRGKLSIMQVVKKYAPGIIVAMAVAAVSKFLESLLPIHIIGASVIALFIGMIINNFWHPAWLKAGLTFTSKKILKFAIILLGLSLSIKTVINVGKMSLIVMVFTLFTCFGVGYFVGKFLKLNWKTSNLISAGTGICGGSAIAALAPVIDADDMDIAYAMSATFLFDMVMILCFPLMGEWLGLSDMAYGLWTGTAVNDTSSVVAAGFATMVKLTRTLSIIPVVLIFAVINTRLKQKQSGVSGERTKVKFTKLFPWFILGFLAMAIINSIGIVPAVVSGGAKDISKFLMVSALAAIGLNTDFKKMAKSGARPMLHGFIISALVVIVAIAVEYAMGIV